MDRGAVLEQGNEAEAGLGGWYSCNVGDSTGRGGDEWGAGAGQGKPREGKGGVAGIGDGLGTEGEGQPEMAAEEVKPAPSGRGGGAEDSVCKESCWKAGAGVVLRGTLG